MTIAKKKILLMGPPAAGKNTQAIKISSTYDLSHVSIGNICRTHIENKSVLGVQIQQYLDQDLLIPDVLVYQLIQEELKHMTSGFILDGFPRTLPQAEWLSQKYDEQQFEVDAFIYLDISDDEIKRRLSGRLSCVGCKATYHQFFPKLQPKVSMVCDLCEDALQIRSDNFETRIQEFKSKTYPAIEHLDGSRVPLYKVSGLGEPDEIFERIQSILTI